MGERGTATSNTTKIFKFAPYIDNRYVSLLDTVTGMQAQMIANSPYASYTDQDTDTAFMGIGYAISDFQSLFDMFGKFMSGLDVELVWNNSFNSLFNKAEASSLVSASTDEMDDNRIIPTISEYKVAMQSKNAVMCSSFIVGKACIELDRIKSISAISLEVNTNLISDAAGKVVTFLNYEKTVVASHAQLLKFYYLASVNSLEANNVFGARNVLWPFTVLDFERAVLGTMRQQAGYSKTELIRIRSGLSKCLYTLSMMVTGAQLGMQVGGPAGAAIGGVIGFVVGLAETYT